jgi:hypothetical protein
MNRASVRRQQKYAPAPRGRNGEMEKKVAAEAAPREAGSDVRDVMPEVQLRQRREHARRLTPRGG